MVIFNNQSNFHTQGDGPECIVDGKHRAGEGLTKLTLLHIVTLSSFHAFIHPGDNESNSQHSPLSLGNLCAQIVTGDWLSILMHWWRRLSPRIQNGHSLVRLGGLPRSWDKGWGGDSVSASSRAWIQTLRIHVRSQNISRHRRWRQADARGNLASQPRWVSEFKVQWWDSILKIKVEGTWGTAPEVDLWPSHVLAHMATCINPLPSSETAEKAPWLPVEISFSGKRRMGIVRLGGSWFNVTVVKTTQPTPEAIRSHMGHRGHPWLRHLQLFQKEKFAVLCRRLLNSRSSQCLFRELLELSSSYKITQTLGA